MIEKSLLDLVPLIITIIGASASIITLILILIKTEKVTLGLILSSIIPLVVAMIFATLIMNDNIEQKITDKNNEKQQLLGMGCKQLKQFIEDVITEKIDAYQDSKETAVQLLLTRCN